MPGDVLEHVADVLGADEDGLGAGERLLPPRRELLVVAHRVLELGAVRLDRVARAARRRDGPAEQDMVGEDEVGRKVLAQRRRVRRHVALTLRNAQLREEAHLEPLVAVEHEDGQQAADVRPHDLAPPRSYCSGMRLLGEDGDVVPGTAPCARERACVHVGAGPSQEVSVPEEDPHPRHLHHSSEQDQRLFRTCPVPAPDMSVPSGAPEHRGEPGDAGRVEDTKPAAGRADGGPTGRRRAPS